MWWCCQVDNTTISRDTAQVAVRDPSNAKVAQDLTGEEYTSVYLLSFSKVLERKKKVPLRAKRPGGSADSEAKIASRSPRKHLGASFVLQGGYRAWE
jgi:hypothetical protein